MFNFHYCEKYVINLATRPERLTKARRAFKKFGLDVETWVATCHKDIVVPELSVKQHEHNAAGILACAMSHISLIAYAKEFCMPYIAIFEDDVVFSDKFNELIHVTEQDEWDIFYLGGHGQTSTRLYGNMHSVVDCAGTYAYILKDTTYDYILRNWNYNLGIDEFLGNFVQRQFKAMAHIPFLIGTEPGYSDVCFHYSDYKIDRA